MRWTKWCRARQRRAVAPPRAMSAAAWLPWIALVHCRRSRRHVGGVTAGAPASREPARQRHLLARHELGRLGRAGRDLTRRQVRGLRRRPRWPVRRLGQSTGHRGLQRTSRKNCPHVDVQEPPAKPRVQWRRVRDLVQPHRQSSGREEFSWRWPVGRLDRSCAKGDSDSRLVAQQRPARVHRRDHARRSPVSRRPYGRGRSSSRSGS